MYSPTIRPVFKRRWIPVAIALAISLMCTLFALTAKASAPGCQNASAKHSKYKRAVPKCASQMARRDHGVDVKSGATRASGSSERLASATALTRGPRASQ
ncbi:hypothetical protein [Variovorax sp. dw_954]|uniref:hypothetical protein n=1 Tax=Variovorax sp. dw_954 TaxID=2720078 RepID=UPI001BD3D168|nr:hypothetical protein [Variovorax sp. dw_954]